jgi:hypothetical protein
MSFKYDPRSASRCLPAGNYEAVLESAEEATSKKGNAMLVVKWTVFESADNYREVKDFIVHPSTVWKLKNIARAWGLLGSFEAGTFDLQDHLQKHITVVMEIQVGDPKYGEQNSIVGYLEPPTAGFAMPTPAAKSVDAGPPVPKEEEIPW